MTGSANGDHEATSCLGQCTLIQFQHILNNERATKAFTPADVLFIIWIRPWKQISTSGFKHAILWTAALKADTAAHEIFTQHPVESQNITAAVSMRKDIITGVILRGHNSVYNKAEMLLLSIT